MVPELFINPNRRYGGSMTDPKVKKPKLVAPPRPGVYSRGSDTVDAILKAALHVLVEEGASAFTLRRIAAQCDMKVGNVSRHFPRKEMLVQVLLEELLTPTVGEARTSLTRRGLPAEEALALVIGGTLDETKTKKMTHLFTELWAMANHNQFVAERIEMVCQYMHDLTASYIAELNPALSPEEVKVVALFINTSIEGATVLAGHGKPWEAMMPQLKAFAVKSLIHLAKTITPEEVQGLRPAA